MALRSRVKRWRVGLGDCDKSGFGEIAGTDAGPREERSEQAFEREKLEKTRRVQ